MRIYDEGHSSILGVKGRMLFKYGVGTISMQLKDHKIGCLFHTIYKDFNRKIKTIRILKENLGDYMYNLRVGGALLKQDWKPRSCKREERHS